MAEILLATESAVSRAPQLSNARLLNFLVERQGVEAKAQAPLFGAPGAVLRTTVGSGPHRGSWNFDGEAYYVSGQSLYHVSAQHVVTLLGTGIGGTGPVGMADNGDQLIIVNGAPNEGWVYTQAGGLQKITADGFYGSATVTFMDGYFLLCRPGTNQWYISGLYDGLAYDPLDFATAEAQPGFTVATTQNLQLLFVFCTKHIELWYDAGTADFPFQRYAGGVIDYGTISPYTVIKQDGAVFFLGADHVFYRIQGNVPIRVSTHAIEHLIQLDPDITQAFCTTWSIEGHKMVCLTLKALGRTVCFDVSTGKWHDRNSVDAGFNDLGPWRFNTVLAVYDEIYLGDSLSGALAEMDWENFTELGLPMLGLIQSANLQQDRKRLSVRRFELDIQSGVGLPNGQGSDPQITLQKSIDGGMTFSDQQPWRSMGKTGEYIKRLRWLGQGSGYQMMFRLVITDPVRRTIIAAHADYEVGM